MQQRFCEPEDRLGSQTSSTVSRPNSMIVQARRSAFIHSQGLQPTGGGDGSFLVPDSNTNLYNPEDARHFDDDIPAEVCYC